MTQTAGVYFYQHQLTTARHLTECRRSNDAPSSKASRAVHDTAAACVARRPQTLGGYGCTLHSVAPRCTAGLGGGVTWPTGARQAAEQRARHRHGSAGTGTRP